MTDKQTLQKLYMPLLVIGAMMWVAFNLVTINRYPVVSCDESFYARTSLQFVTGLFGGRLWPPPPADFYLFHGRTYWFLLGSVLAVLGKGLSIGRLFSLVGWMGLVAATYLIARSVFERGPALWAVVLTATAWTSFFVSRYIRPDVLAAASTLFIFALMIFSFNKKKWWLFLLLGFLLIFQLDVHFITVHFVWPVAAIAVFLLVKQRDYRNLGALLVGMAISGLLVAWLHLQTAFSSTVQEFLSDPVGLIQLHIGGQGYAQGGGLSQTVTPWTMLVSFARFWWDRYAWLGRYASLPQAALFLFGLVYVLFSGNSTLKQLGIVVVLSNLSYMVVNVNYTPCCYEVMWLPYYIILGVAAVVDWVPRVLSFIPHLASPAPQIILLALTAAYISGDIYLVAKYPSRAYETVGR
nr:glycosyltransferase family 39 protein [Anaerolineae bacterium]